MLLEALIDWARDCGHERVSLDLEAANIQSSRFWPKHLTPVCYSIIGHINDHILTPRPRG